MTARKEEIEKKIEGKKLTPIQEKKEKKFKLKLDEKEYSELRKFIHGRFIGDVSDPILEKLGMTEKEGTTEINSENLKKFHIWLDLSMTGQIRIPILKSLQKFIKEESV